MSVRRETRRDPSTGTAREFWFVDFVFRHPDGRRERIRQVSPVPTKRGAEQHERQLREHVAARGTERKEAKVSPLFKEFADEFLDTYAKTNNKPSEVETKRMICRNHLVPAFGTVRLEAIGLLQIERYKGRKQLEGLSAKTINNHLTVLRKILGVAVEWGVLEHLPPVKWLRAPKPGFRFLDFDEASRLVAATEPEWRAMIVLALHTGLRLGELRGLRWEDVDLERRFLMVSQAFARGHLGTPKNGRVRKVSLSETACAALGGHRTAESGALVFSGPGGKPLTTGLMVWPLWRACDAAGLPRLGWHALRHTFASHLAMSGAPMVAVQQLMGHSTLEMTSRYAHLSESSRQEAVDRLQPHGNLMATDGGAVGN